MKILQFIVATLLMAGQVCAQNTAANPTNVLPPPPWLNKAPNMSHWVITYAQTPESPASAIGESSAPDNNNPMSAQKIPPKMIEVSKTGKTIVEKVTNASGVTLEKWRKDGLILVKISTKPDWFVGSIPPANDTFEEPDYSITDFAGFAWITATNFVGIQTIQSKKCIVFKDKVLPLSASDRTARQDEAAYSAKQAKEQNHNYNPPSHLEWDKYKVNAEADIDLKTLLPVRLIVGPVIQIYQHLPPPDSELDLPEDAQLALMKYKKGIATIRNMSAGSP